MMAYDEGLAQRVREILQEETHQPVERKMFGGIAFMVQGNVACGLTNDDLMVRIGKENYQDALARPYARPMDFTGRPMKGWVYVSQEGLESDEALSQWVQRGVAYALSLPPK